MGVIYQIVIAGGGKTYIGSAHDLKSRQKGHLSLLRKDRHHSRALQNAVHKHGVESISWIILEEVEDRSRLIEREQVWLDAFKGRLYNTSPTAQSRLGAKMPSAAKAMISASLIGNQYRKGIPHDEETRARISAKLRLLYATGQKRLSPETDSLDKYWAEVNSGRRQHPTKMTSAYIISVLADLALTGSVRLTGTNLGLNMSADILSTQIGSST